MNLYHERLLLGEAIGDPISAGFCDPDLEMLEDLIWRDGDEIVILDRETGEIERLRYYEHAED